MGVQEQNNRRRGMLLGEEGNSLVMLLAINAIIFGLFNFIKAAYFLGNMDLNDYYKNILGWFLVPADAHGLVSRPWSVLTYMFTHDGEGLSGVAKLIGNMLWLWVFGYILQDLTGNRHLAPLYLYGGVAGAIFFLLTVNSFPVLRNMLPTMEPLQGANAAVMAIAVATTVMAPGYRIFPFLNGGIPLWVLTLVFVAVDYAMVAGSGAGLGVAHLAGGLVGFLYVGRLKAGKDWGAWMHQLYKWFFSLFDPAKRVSRQQEMRNEVFYQQGKQPAFRKKPIVTQQKIDDILDKINQQGYHLLTDEEKEYLKTASKEVD
jgi:membrane associated rhomboid family serine protease